MSSIANTSYAQVYKNKGPAFISSKKFSGGFTQRTLVKLYAGWNLHNLAANAINKKKIKSNFNDIKSIDSIKLNPLNISDNLLSFGYKDEAGLYKPWSFVGTQYGYCHGMTMVSRQFFYFAEFKPEMEIPAKIVKSERKIEKYFEDKIDDVMNGIPTVFPKYKNLTELSKTNVEEHIMRHVADQWGLNTAQYPLYKQYSDWEYLDEKSLLNLVDDLKYYLEKGFYPRLILGNPLYSNRNPHVVLITKYSFEKTNENSHCLKLTYLNVGDYKGTAITESSKCIGVNSKVIMPKDEKIYFQDFAAKLAKDNKSN